MKTLPDSFFLDEFFVKIGDCQGPTVNLPEANFMIYWDLMTIRNGIYRI